jgi:hypothetical protein
MKKLTESGYTAAFMVLYFIFLSFEGSFDSIILWMQELKDGQIELSLATLKLLSSSLAHFAAAGMISLVFIDVSKDHIKEIKEEQN